MYRTSKWKRETKPNNIQKYAKEEIKCSFAIVIDIANQNEEEISKTSRSILGMCYERENIRIIFSSSSQQVDTQTLINEVHHFNELGMKSELVIHSPQSTQTEKDKDAFRIMDLEFNVEWPTIQKKFKTLVKKLHPDRNSGNKQYEDKLKKITLAYSHLKIIMIKK